MTCSGSHLVSRWNSEHKRGLSSPARNPESREPCVIRSRRSLPYTNGRIVVGSDGSQPGWRASRWAVDEARLRQALLEVVLVFDIGSPALSFGLSSVAAPKTDRL